MAELITSVLRSFGITGRPPPGSSQKARASLPWHTLRAVRPPVAPLFLCRQFRRNAALKLAFQGMDSKRGSPRQRVLKSGKIVFAGGSISVDCTIRNLSEAGARLQIPTTVAIPDRFTLVDAHARTRREATVIWRKGDQIGVRFDLPKT